MDAQTERPDELTTPSATNSSTGINGAMMTAHQVTGNLNKAKTVALPVKRVVVWAIC